MNELARLFRKHGTSKFRHHRYDMVYEWLLAPLRTKPDLRVLEVGVKQGRSIRAWEEYFPQAEIVGVDINPKCSNVARQRATIVIGDSNDTKLMQSLGEFDIVIDDGCHQSDAQLRTFRSVWPHTKSRYCVEDVGLVDKTLRVLLHQFRRIRGETRIFGGLQQPACWTVFAGQLLAFVRLPVDTP